MLPPYLLFQFTPLREGRLPMLPITTCGKYFNSRPSARGDDARHTGRNRPHHFNSRPSARGDNARASPYCERPISIHAPPRGATGRMPFLPPAWVHFNSRPSARGDQADNGRTRTRFYFNSRPSARGDDVANAVPTSKDIFQFTPLREGRRWRNRRCPRPDNFNSRPSARGDSMVYT